MRRRHQSSFRNGPTGFVPLGVKLSYTLFVAILVPRYWHDYGPTNFLYFCDVALLLTLVSLWLERPLLASASAVGILVPQAVWMADYLGSQLHLPLTGMTAYMFSDTIPLFTRFLSFFHFWLPLFILWLLSRLGYDRRALVLWIALAVILFCVCYFYTPPPPAPVDNPNLPVNINYVYGINDSQPQHWMDRRLYFACLLIFMPVLVYWPTHLALRRVFASPVGG